MITSNQQRALNSYVDYANQSAREVGSVVKSVIDYYPRLNQIKSRTSGPGLRYVCPIQQEEYYYKKAMEESKGLSNGSALNGRMDELRSAEDKIDQVCKQLDVYHKLEDYKSDNYTKADELIQSLPALLSAYQKMLEQLDNELTRTFSKFQQSGSVNNYVQASKTMLDALKEEKSFLDLWNHNVEEDIPSGWITEPLEKSILKTADLVKKFDERKIDLKYPASSQYTAFIENVSTVLDAKRSALDNYNADAKKSDKHSNYVYHNLINYYNGTLVSFYNSFVQYAHNDGYYGLKALEYVTTFSIRKEAVAVRIEVSPYKDIPFEALHIAPQSKPIAVSVAVALNSYVDFINACVRQMGFMQRGIHNLNASATRYKGLTDFKGKVPLRYDFSDFKIPLSKYQELATNSSVFPANVAQALVTQAEVLINILKEMEQRSELLVDETTTRRYEQDQLDGMFKTFERYNILFETLDMKKELLYHDVRMVYDSYPVDKPTQNWILSWRALRSLTDDDHGALFQAKAYYKGVSTTLPQTTSIDKQLREVLANEYENMKGIEKYGRNNGRCPYTPYEDLPATSRRLSEKLNNLSTVSLGGRHPYHDLVYLYNDVVDDYNKFCELSKLELLKTVRQPEFFEVLYPTQQAEVERKVVPVVAPMQTSQQRVDNARPDSGASGRSGVVHDTVYIEKHDTIYLATEGEELRTMEGYASNNMVLLLDVSGSMNAVDKLPLLKKSVLDLLSMMRKEDQVSIVVYSGKAKVLLQPVSFKEEEKIKAAINALTSSGKTDGNAGIKLAYQVADKNYIRGGNNRIILATDGEFPISDDISSLVDKYSKEDIFLSVFNFGKGSGSSKTLEKLSATGHGNYEHITRENMDVKLIHEVKGKKAK